MNLIFDLDGTLINSLPGIAQSLNSALEQNHLPTHSLEAIREFIGNGSRTLCERAATSADQATVDKIEASFKVHYQELWKSGTEIYPGIQELLDDLSKTHQLSVLSNKPHGFTTEIVTQLFPENTFHTVLGQREGIEKKPDPKGIYEVLELSSQTDQKSFLIGDSVVDLQTARNASIGSIAVTWGFEDLEELQTESPNHVVHSVSELKTLIHSL
ncbi:MAG: HAD family hydrolase [Akkermansiaceae bacterium]